MRSLNRFVALAALFCAIVPAAALAQKPALTQNIDEFGRTPYLEKQALSNNLALFSAVPAGKQLVITKLNCFSNSVSYSGTTLWTLNSINSLNDLKFVVSGIPGPAAPATYYGLNADTLLYVDAGVQPFVNVTPGVQIGQCTLAGHFIANP